MAEQTGWRRQCTALRSLEDCDDGVGADVGGGTEGAVKVEVGPRARFGRDGSRREAASASVPGWQLGATFGARQRMTRA